MVAYAGRKGKFADAVLAFGPRRRRVGISRLVSLRRRHHFGLSAHTTRLGHLLAYRISILFGCPSALILLTITTVRTLPL